MRVDVEEFLALTDQARSPIVGPQRAAAAAIETYAGAAVPELGDRSWVVAAQRHLEQRLLAMHDLTPSDELARLDAYLRRNESFGADPRAARTAEP